MQSFKLNLAEFAAGKNHALNQKLRAQLYDKDGNRRTKAQFEEKAKHILKRYNNEYLEVEQGAAFNAADAAQKWDKIQQRKKLYPLLKYVTVGDDRVRPSHQALDDIVRPVDDPFWATHFPPIDWRCRCITNQVDDEEEITPLPNNLESPKKGFNHNPGISNKLFSDDHPYFDFDKIDKDKMFTEAQYIINGEYRKEVKQIAKQKINHPVALPNLQPITISGNVLSSLVSHVHNKAPITGLDIIPHLDDFAKHFKFVGHEANRKADKLNRVKFWVYAMTILNEDFYLKVEEIENILKNGKIDTEFRIYAITEYFKPMQ